jgi:CRISPR/Cas system Type II protein with McrA/HNH and RuvC-like nuclease domain
LSVSRYIDENTRQEVRKRAKYLCEYCHAIEKWQYVQFTIDHVIPLDQGGANSLNNLALACFHCNRRKSNKITVIDSQSKREVALFNPRLHNWKDHFIWSTDKLYIIGLTTIGSATIQLLDLNRSRIINIRAADLIIDRHPPTDDPVLSE